MNAARFEQSTRGSIHLWRYLAVDPTVSHPRRDRDAPLVDSGWPDDVDDDVYSALSSIGIRRAGVGAELHAYAGMVWRLTEGRSRYAIVPGNPVGADAAHYDYIVDPKGTDWVRKDRGFCPLRRPSALVSLETPTEWRHLVQERDWAFSFTVLGLVEGQVRCAEVLRRASAPSLENVLAPGEVLVQLSGADDLGYHGSILVASPDDLTEALDRVVREVEARVTAFETAASTVRTFAAYAAALGRLSGLGADEPK
jgi:hypothetical protein